MTSVNSLIDQRSQLHPNKIAVKHNDKTFSYQQIVTQSNQLAHFFNNNGLNTNDVAGIAIDRSGEMLIALIAVMKIGVAYLPIDNEVPIERIKYMLEDSSVKTLITSKKYQDKYADIANVIFIEDALQASAGLDSETLEPQTDPDRLTYILYTSGSTGKPKGVGIKHSSLLNFLLSIKEAPGMDEEDILLFSTTISFDIAQLEIYLPLISGGSTVIADVDKVRDSRELLALAKAENVTIIQGTPFMWRMMIEAGWVDPLPLKILCGGEAMTKDLADKLLERCKSLWNMYGPTETTIWSAIKNIKANDGVITIGKAIRNTDIYLLDEDLNPVEAGTIGEICIGGDGVANGYINRPELTSEKFIKDKFTNKEGQKIYRTGDLGRVLDNGDILCLGRIDHQIKIRGFRIESEEIEIQLKQLNNIKEAVISSYKDSLNNVHLVAYIVPFNPIIESAKSEIINSWNTSLSAIFPVYMIPDWYMIIPSLPLMINGKLDRKALPEPAYQANEENYQEAKTDTEAALVKIGLKNIAIDKIGVTDNLFELGVDSLVGVRIMVQIEKEFGKRLPLSILVKYPTIRQLAQVLQNGVPDSEYKFLIPLKETGAKVPLYIIHGIGLNLLNLHEVILNIGNDQPVYGLQSVGLDGTMAVPDNLEEVARLYIEEITKHDPVGPYCIAGYSFGGYIAYEMVKQLKEANKEVKLLAMFDTNLQYPTYQYPFVKKVWVKGIRQLKKIFFRTSTLIFDPVKTFDYLSKSFGYFEDYDPENLPDFMQEIAEKLTMIFFKYQFKPYNIQITLFKAKERLFFVDDPKYLGWGKYALNGVEVFEVSGDHKEMFGTINAKKLADVLQKKLDNI